MKLIDKDALVAEIDKRLHQLTDAAFDSMIGRNLIEIKDFIDTLEVKEVDIDKLCEFRKNIGFAYPEGASEYQNQLACYLQGIKDAIKAMKGE